MSRDVREAERRRLEFLVKEKERLVHENERVAKIVKQKKERDREKRESMFERIVKKITFAGERREQKIERRRKMLRKQRLRSSNVKLRRMQEIERLQTRLVMKQMSAAARRESNVKCQRKRKRDIHETKRRRARVVAEKERDRARSLERDIEARVERARIRRIEHLREIQANAHAIFERLMASSPISRPRQATPEEKPPSLYLSSSSSCCLNVVVDSDRKRAILTLQTWFRNFRVCASLRSSNECLSESFETVERCRNCGPIGWGTCFDDDEFSREIFASCGFEDFAKRLKDTDMRFAARDIVESCMLSSDRSSSSSYQKARQFLIAILISKFPQVVSSIHVVRRARALESAFSQLRETFLSVLDNGVTSLLRSVQRFEMNMNSFSVVFEIWLRNDRIRLLKDAAASITSINLTLSEETMMQSSNHSNITSALETMRDSIQRDVIDILSPPALLFKV